MAEEVAATTANMAEEEAMPAIPLNDNFIPEIILKKRKSNEEWALRKKQQLEERKFRIKQNKADNIKKAEDFVKDFRNKELDLIRMKQRAKRFRPESVELKSQLLFVVRIQGSSDMHTKTRKLLYSMGLRKIFNGVFLKANEGTLEKLKKVEPYVTYGYPSPKSVKDLIYKRGHAKIEKRRAPLTDNNLIEQELGKYGIVCIEDMVHEILNVGPHFKEVTSFMWPFILSKPEGALKGNKFNFKDGGDTGNREDHINELISKMN